MGGVNEWSISPKRFWAKVDRSGDCWMWTASVGSKGYGSFNVRIDGQRKTRGPHQVSYYLANGPIPTGLMIDHRCHTPLCVNPAHLRLATAKQNNENRSVVRAVSGVRGVTWDSRTKRWRAELTHNHKKYRAGRYRTIPEAEAVITALRNELFTHNELDKDFREVTHPC